MNNQLYSINQLAGILSVSHTLIRKWCKQKQIPFGIKNGQIMFNIEMINKIKSWYLNKKTKTGRPNKPDNTFSITDLSKNNNIESKKIKADIELGNIAISRNKNGLFFFNESQYNEAVLYYQRNNIKKNYTANEAAAFLNIEPNILRFLCKIGRVDHTKTDTNRFLFNLEQLNEIFLRLNSNVPLLDEEELQAFNKEKKEYYKEWYKENKFKIKIRRQNK